MDDPDPIGLQENSEDLASPSYGISILIDLAWGGLFIYISTIMASGLFLVLNCL